MRFSERELNDTASILIMRSLIYDKGIYKKPGEFVSSMKDKLPAIDELKSRHFDILPKGNK